MCGIAGLIATGDREHSEQQLTKMLNIITHRGPDDDGTYVGHKVAIGMRRLSIIDVEHGQQPFTSTNGRYITVTNGEIYNNPQLRGPLINKGHRFVSKSDCEPIAHMFEDEGPACVPHLSGMFAIAAVDTERSKLYLVRDRFGIKPLYYQVTDGKMTAFASEIKSLLAIHDETPQVNDNAILDFLSFQYNPNSETFFKGIHKLPPAHTLTVDLNTGEFSVDRYFEMTFEPEEEMTSDRGVQELATALEDSVASHLQSDVPLGVFLSSGIDSALLAALAKRARPKEPLRSFTIGGTSKNEFVDAAEIAKYLDTDHTEIQMSTQSFFDALGPASWHFDEPVADPSAIALYRLAEEVTKHVTVVISGDGADELFGGYRIYREPYAVNRVLNLPKPLRTAVLKGARLPAGVRGTNFLRRAEIPLEERFIGNAFVFKRAEAAALWRDGDVPQFHDLSPLYDRYSDLTDQQQMQLIDINRWLPGDILAKSDKMTMAHSLELRVPYLDPDVAAVATRVPDRLKYADKTTKWLLRQVASRYLPPSMHQRPKLGFPVPLARWLREHPGQLTTVIENPLIQEKFDVDQVRSMVQSHVSGEADYARKLFVLKSLATWYDTFMLEDHGQAYTCGAEARS